MMKISATEINVINNAVFPVEKIIWWQQLQLIQDIILRLTTVQLKEWLGVFKNPFPFYQTGKFTFLLS